MNNAFVGQDLGVQVKGDFLVGTPMLLLRLGPLYPDRTIFWKFAIGVGVALVRFGGQIQPYPDIKGYPMAPVGTPSRSPAAHVLVNWEFQVDAWVLSFESSYLYGHAGNDPYTFEAYSLSLAHTYRF